MTDVLFICSGNTCRSPMAKALAHEIFGPGHSLASSGAEAAVDLPAAKHAITAMKELGIDISAHRATQLDIATLEQFDTIVVFRPSAAEDVALPATAAVEFLDVRDPVGGSLDDYRNAARRIRSGVRALYAKDALRRLESSNPPTGSHLSGMYVRAARELEKELRSFANASVNPAISDKATLGQLASALRSTNQPSHRHLAGLVEAANKPWVDMKHHGDPKPTDVRGGLRAMIQAFQHLSAEAAA